MKLIKLIITLYSVKFQRSFKNGLYVDYFFKKFFFVFYKKIISTTLFYIFDKYLIEKFFFLIKKLNEFVFFWIDLFRQSTLKESLKLIMVISIQIALLIIL